MKFSRKKRTPFQLRAKRLGIEAEQQAIVYLHERNEMIRFEGFRALPRVQVKLKNHSCVATLECITTNDLLRVDEIGLSEYAWGLLHAKRGDIITLSHPPVTSSLSYVHDKIFGRVLARAHFESILEDIVAHRLSDVQMASFLTACATSHLSIAEIAHFTEAMVAVGKRLTWPYECILDKHCIGGLPGNRTTLILVPIIAAYGLPIPKTSSRAITSAAGTADTMEVFAPVDLSIQKMRRVVEHEGGCITWGGKVGLSPADDLLVHVERLLNLNSLAQVVASVLSKKVAAGSTHVLIDIPKGPTAKIRNNHECNLMTRYFETVGKRLGLQIRVLETDGTQPVGRGVGPALEARDVLQVLQCAPNAPQDLRNRALELAGTLLEFSAKVRRGKGIEIARSILDSGKALTKFQAICEAQGDFRKIPESKYRYDYCATHAGVISVIHNHRIGRIAKLTGAPIAKTAGIDLHVRVGDEVKKGDVLFTLHSQSKGELYYALSFLKKKSNCIIIE